MRSTIRFQTQLKVLKIEIKLITWYPWYIQELQYSFIKPLYIDYSIEYMKSMEKLIADNPRKVVAIGECGLDYDRLHFCPKDIQKK